MKLAAACILALVLVAGSAATASPLLRGYYVSATLDYDRDDRPDLVISSPELGTSLYRTVLYRSDGAPLLVNMTVNVFRIGEIPGVLDFLEVMDLDDDGRDDLVLRDHLGLRCYMNRLDANGFLYFQPEDLPPELELSADAPRIRSGVTRLPGVGGGLKDPSR